MSRDGSEYDSIAGLYDFAVEWNPADDVPFFLEAARRSGGPILELACGTGRVSRALVQAGMTCVGIDISVAMLSTTTAREPARQIPGGKYWRICADMRQFALTRTFPLIIVPFRSFNLLLTREWQDGCLQCVRRHLARDGSAILTAYDPARMLRVDGSPQMQGRLGRPFTLPDGRAVTGSYRVLEHDRTLQIVSFEFTYVTRGQGDLQTTVHISKQRYCTAQEMVALLESNGFRIRHCYGDYDRGALRDKWNRDFIVEAEDHG